MTTSPKTTSKAARRMEKPGPGDVASVAGSDAVQAKKPMSKAKAKKPKSKAEMRKATGKGNAKKA